MDMSIVQSINEKELQEMKINKNEIEKWKIYKVRRKGKKDL